jgi:hypothetical protein
MNNKIAFIVPYFGKLPRYFPLFMNSIKGKSFDVLFFTDIERPEYLPENMIWHSTTFNELKALFASKLDMKIALSKPYKLCDYRPAFGRLFDNYLVQYQFWGNIDIDTIVGGFDDFITDERLARLDVYSGVKEYLSGSLFFVRNNEYCNTLFRKSKDWAKVFTTEKYLGFDECGAHIHHQLQAGANFFELKTDVQSITEIIFLEAKSGLRAAFTDEILEAKGFNFVAIETDGIKYLNKKYILLHFIYFKTRIYFIIQPDINTAPYYVNNWGNFKYPPNKLNLLFSKNFAMAAFKKIEINLKKLKNGNN